MIYLSEQQLSKRYNSLPNNLRDILDSPNIGNIVRRVCEQQHLSPEKTEVVAQIAAEVILGLIHLEDLSKEIQLNISLDKRIADLISDEINKKIFSSIKEDLIKNYYPLKEEFYAPSPKVAALIQESRKIINEIQKENERQEALVDLRTFGEQKIEEDKAKATTITMTAEKPAEAKKELPVVPLPSEAAVKPEAKPFVAIPLEKIVSEEAAPVILHKEIETKPTLGEQRSFGGLFGFLKSQKGEVKTLEQKSITAEVEIPIVESNAKLPIHTNVAKNFKSEEKVEMSKIAQELSKPPRVVHYSDFKTPVSPRIAEKKLEDRSRELGWQKLGEIKKEIEVPMPPIPKPSDIVKLEKPEGKNKIFKSELAKAREAGLIINYQQPKIDSRQLTADNTQFNIEGKSIEIEAAPRQNFFSRIFQFFVNLFITRKKVIKEVSIQPTTVKMPEMPMPPAAEAEPPKQEKLKEFEFPLEIKISEPFGVAQDKPPVASKIESFKKEPELSKSAMSELKTNIFEAKELEPPEIHEVRERPQPTIPQPEKSNMQDKDIIDLRTFQKITK